MKRRRGKKQARQWALILGMLLVSFVRSLAADIDTVGSDAILKNGSETVISDIQVVIVGPPDQRERHAAMAKRLIRLHPADHLDKAALQASIDALKFSRRFSAIHVDSSSDPGGETLTFTLTPYRTIADIRIRGKYPLFERDILNQMTLYPGDPFTREDLSAQAGAIIKRYQREGYIDPKVSITAQRDNGNDYAVIRVDIDKGSHFALGTLVFEGNRVISSNSLAWHMSVWRSSLFPGIGRFSEYRLKKDMESLLTYYRRKGFADAQLSYRIDDTGGSHQVNVTVLVREGRRYTVAFEGNRRFWDLTLKKDVAIFKDGNRSNVGVRKSVRNIKKRYHEDGFLDVRIKAETILVPGTPVETLQLRFVIHEGPQTIVDRVTIAGNHALPEKEIRKQILTRPPTIFHEGAFVPETLETDTYAVTTLYLKQGFRERTVDSEVTFNEDKTGADISLNIKEGPRTTVGSIAIKGLTVLPEAKARKVLVHKIGDPFRTAALDAEKEAIASLVSEKGYPHATVQASVTYSQDRTRADIVFEVDAGPQVTMGDIFVSGNLRTAEKVIRRELEVQPRTPLSLQSLYNGQRRLRDLEIFHGVSYRTFGLKEKEKTVDLFVEIEENKPYYAQTSAGYQSDSGFFGRTKAGDHNLFGLNKDLWAEAEISQTGYRVETRLTEPRFLSTRTTASIGAFNEELTEFNQPFGTRTTGGSIGFGRDWGKHVNTALSFRLEKRDQFSVEDRPPEEVDDETRTIFVTTPYVRYDSRDSFVRPTRGLLSSVGVDISKGVQNQLDDFFRYQFDTRYYWTPLEKVTLAGLARIGQVIPYADSELVPDDQLFFLGGIQSVRGFDENLLRVDNAGNPVGGKTAVVGSLEARIDLGMNLELTTFFDIGSVQHTLVEGGSDRFRSSIGIGLRYITPIGPMGLLYGHKLDPDDGESAGRFHLSIGYSF
ncbi:outer membrane protein assembly factor BamA [uncultured Desulfosarcina sp.]|uniref:outer membrane protein assembly factor BamA n=1 Tax=uncultured Desulfosarcina sp. TaxID=218289 RepID=UPI0029C648F9|nr:outer membrane protein assembly factor BamA [uncultured Desulfosarcina sp.]